MMVYGDRERTLESGAQLAQLERLARRAAEPSAQSLRRELCTELLIEAGVLAQGLLDARHATRGCDELGPHERACARLCLAAGGMLLLALDGASDQPFVHASTRLVGACAALRALQPPDTLRVREPEGYAFYALYPELYVAAARELLHAARGAPLRVIGIRSIGTSLAGVVGATLGASLALTVRPVGHVFARELRIGKRLERALLYGASRARYALVDEGPGLSGSSFAAVHAWLLARGVCAEQVCFLPSHAGAPGPRCAREFRATYAGARRYQCDFDTGIAPGLAQLCAPLLGCELAEPPLDVSGGRWRSALYADVASYPRSHVPHERRKYLLRTRRGTFLLKFMGLGANAQVWLDRVRALGAHGLAPAVCGARHGFALTPWLCARPLDAARVERASVVRALADYLLFLAQHFPMQAAAGARPAALLSLMRANVTELLGAAAADALRGLDALLPSLETTHRPVATDNKLDAYEWLQLPDGRILKSDALEHAHAHDAIGCQDLAWDVAGAFIEFALTQDERERLLALLRDRGGLRFRAAKLHFFELAYLAFRAGHAELAESGMAEGWPDDALRMARAKQAYVERLSACVSEPCPKISESSRSTSSLRGVAAGSHTYSS